MSSVATPSPRQERTFLGHPLGLYILFFTEMWERFSYYGMRALFMLYMLNWFKWSQADASTYYKVYTTAVYVTPIVGGYLADRYLGNKRAVIIGAVLMAIGHFLMAFERLAIFQAALVFLILGNGFFKPNMSTQVGRLYPPGDGRRDGAYTIFYMGINLGAFMSSIVCGWLQENTVGGYHSGFTMAGIGMLIGLVTYVVGQPLIREYKSESGPTTPQALRAAEAADSPLTEEQASKVPSRLGFLYRIAPVLLAGVGIGMIIAAPVLWYWGKISWPNAAMIAIGGGSLLMIAGVCRQVVGGVRDRVLAILAMGIFVIFFFAAFELAGNPLNVWADKNTNRYITGEMQDPELLPTVIEAVTAADKQNEEPREVGIVERFTTMFQLKPSPADKPEKSWGETLTASFNPMPTAWFQSINALAIFVIAPLFAWMWVALDRRGWQPSIPLKMVLGLLLMSASMAVMIAAAQQENKPTEIAFAGELPAGLSVDAEGRVGHDIKGVFTPLQAGRLRFDAAKHQVKINGILSDNDLNHLVQLTAPPEFRKSVEELAEQSAKIDNKDIKSVQVELAETPPEFDMKYAGIPRSIVRWDPASRTLTALAPLQDKETQGLLVAAGEPKFRALSGELFLQTSRLRVSSWWLFWNYILATLGELCLSPVGLSMVSKLAPAKFATMLMGVWLMVSAFGNFAAGTLGEVWGTVPPVEFFVFATAIVGGAAVVLLILCRWIVSAMHGVK